MGRKLWGCVPSGEAELGPHLIQCGRGRAYVHAKFHLDPSSRLATIHDVTDRTGRQTDRQRSDSIRRTVLQTVAQKRLNRWICRLGCGLGLAEERTSSIVFATWRYSQCALMGGCIGATWRIRLNRPSAAATRLRVKLLSLLVVKVQDLGHYVLDPTQELLHVRQEVAGLRHDEMRLTLTRQTRSTTTHQLLLLHLKSRDTPSLLHFFRLSRGSMLK